MRQAGGAPPQHGVGADPPPPAGAPKPKGKPAARPSPMKEKGAKSQPSNPDPTKAKKDDEPEEERMMFFMLFPTSGRCGFDRIQWREPGPPPIAREALKTLLTTERDVRLSAECQQRFTDAYETGGDIAAVSEWAQEKALRACGYEPTERNVLMLRSALSLYPDVPVSLIRECCSHCGRMKRFSRSHSTASSTALSVAISMSYVHAGSC